MIVTLKANGFRSLSRFSLTLGQGVSVLVGPNGAGKSNILAAFDFISNVAESPLAKAIELAGGVTRVFDRTSDATSKTPSFNSPVAFDVTGIFPLPVLNSSKPDIFLYFYSFAIRLTRDYLPYFEHQTLEIEKAGKDLRKDRSRILKLVQKRGSGKVTLSDIDTKLIGAVVRSDDHHKFESYLRGMLPQIDAKNQTLFDAAGPFIQLAHMARMDVIHHERLLIDPPTLRAGDDLTLPPVIQSTGRGAVSTFYALSRGVSSRFSKTECKALVHQVTDELRLAIPSLVRLEIDPNGRTGKFDLSLHLRIGERVVPFSADMMSDGALKWFVIIIALKTRQVFSIEEPENFLHPRLQRELVRIVRESCEPVEQDRVILTTHSETLLNACEPKDIRIVTMRHGITKLQQPTNLKTVLQEVERTGFGLGHYYLAGMLTDGET